MMFQNYLFLVFLPAVAYSTITVKIQVSTNEDDASVTYKGQDTATISDKEQKTFHLEQESLRNATEYVNGKACPEIYVKSPTPYGDIFLKNGWQEVERTLMPVYTKILSLKTVPVLLDFKKYTNRNRVPTEYTESIQKVVKEIVNHTWYGEYNLTIEKMVNYDINFDADGVGNITSLIYKSHFGKNYTQERKVTIGTISSPVVSVPPNGILMEYLIATKGKMEVEVKYRAKVKGDVICRYRNAYKGQQYYVWPVNYLLKKGELPNNVEVTEKITVRFNIKPTVMLINGTSGAPIKNVVGGIIKLN